MTIQQEGNKLSPDTYLELYEIDFSTIGLEEITDKVYLTNSPQEIGKTIIWKGKTYSSLPMEFTGVEYKADGSAPARPTLTVSNINKALMIPVYVLGDLAGTTVRRWRTFYKYTANGTEPNNDAHYPVDEFIIVRKVTQSPTVLKLELSSALDRPGLMLPRRQILRDLGFPGVSRVRLR
jgi:lambda family phage minor tail protein L